MNTENKPENPQAFPNTTVNADGIICGKSQEGMTLRDYFANSAMQGLLSNSTYKATLPKDAQDLAILTYQIADAMLKQR